MFTIWYAAHGETPVYHVTTDNRAAAQLIWDTLNAHHWQMRSTRP